MHKSSENGSGGQQNFPVRELITKCIVGSAVRFTEAHQVDNKTSRSNEEHLHEGVVNTDEVHKQIHVSHAEYKQVCFHGFARKT